MDFMVLLGHFNESNETTAPLSGAPADQWPVVLLYMGDVARRVDAVKLDFQHGRSVAFIGQEDKATKHLLTILDQFVEDIIGTPKQFPSPGPLEPS